MTTAIKHLDKMRSKALLGGGKKRIQKQHDKGKLTARERLDILLDREIEAKSDNPPISGRADFLLKHADYDKIGLELKSINDKGFEALKNRPKREHTVQLQIYLHILILF